jgi:hypothetical protein
MAEPPGKSDRYNGEAVNGTVTLRSFDDGVVRMMRATLLTPQRTAGFGANYFIQNVPNMTQPPDYPGVPVTFSVPTDIFEEYRIPVVVVQRTSIQPAMQRWHPGAWQYRAPAAGAAPVTFNGMSGFNRYALVSQAIPFDIDYTIRIIARNRGGASEATPRSQANALFMYLISIWQPYSAVYVEDSIGDIRSYSVTAQYGVEDEVIDVTARTIGFTIDITVEGELDLNQEVEFPSVQQYASIDVEQK